MVDLEPLLVWLDCGGCTPISINECLACSRLESLAICLDQAATRAQGREEKRGKNRDTDCVENQADPPAQSDIVESHRPKNVKDTIS
jgi:hypothetical protein